MALVSEPFTKGTFTAGGSSDSISVDSGWLLVEMTGGEITLEVKGQNGSWIPATTDINVPATLTASGGYPIKGLGFEYRLTRASHSGDAYYELHAGS